MRISRRTLATSKAPAIVTLRKIHRFWKQFSLPAPNFIVKPILWLYVAVRNGYHGFLRVFIAEPLFKANCRQYGKGVRTGIFVHWIRGKGDIIIGNNVLIDGKCSFAFAARYSPNPTLKIGDHSGIGHNCRFTIAKQISIGNYCRIASDVTIFDSPGHPTNPQARLAGLPPSDEEVRPVVIGDNVWIGRRAILYPGVTIGDNSIVSAGAVVAGSVPPNVVVAGNPARKILSLSTDLPPDAGPAINKEGDAG